ncbi:MAG: twin-arginine translocation signal domain-containing protein [Alistipes onderdonkii]
MDRRKFIKTVGMTAGTTLFPGIGKAEAAGVPDDKNNSLRN